MSLSLGVLGPSERDLAQGEFSFFSFAMLVFAHEVAPASKMDEAGAGKRGTEGTGAGVVWRLQAAGSSGRTGQPLTPSPVMTTR